MNALDILLIGNSSGRDRESPSSSGTATAPGGSRLHAGSLEEVHEILGRHVPDLVVIDRIPAGTDEVQLLRAFRNRYLPVVLLVNEDGTTDASPVIRKRADHQVPRNRLLGEGSVDVDNLLNESGSDIDEQLKALELELIDETNFDLTTKLPDSTALKNQIERYLSGEDSSGTRCGLISVQIAGLETLGTDRRSRFLKWTADLLTVTVDEDDFVARESEARFFVVTPPGPIPGALKRARSIKDELAQLTDRLEGPLPDEPEFRIGLASAGPEREDPEELIREATETANARNHEPSTSVGGTDRLLSSYLDRFFRRTGSVSDPEGLRSPDQTG